MVTEDNGHKPARAPAGLGATGRKRWRKLTSAYVWRPDELDALEGYCRQADDTVFLEAAAVGQPAYIEGSRGQQIMNPIFAEIRASRQAEQRLRAALGLADAVDEDGTRRSTAARRMALRRWSDRR